MATSADLLSLSIDTAGTLKQVLARLDTIPQGINKAKARALRRLKTWLNRQVAKAVSAATGVTQAKWKALLRIRSGKTATGGIVIWIGTNPIAAQYLGTVKWTRRMKGARAGRQLFPGTWSWAGKSGAKTGAGIMRRTDDGIAEVTVAVHEAVVARLQSIQPALESQTLFYMEAELKAQLYLENR